jgi:hypothetical protein
MSLVFPSTIRSQVLAQHEKLRELANKTLAETAGSSLDVNSLERCAREVHERFHSHLLFEESALVPVLWVVDGWGPERVDDLRREHARQRQELDAVIQGLESGWSAERLALELTRLAGDLLKDMIEEEEGCLRASLLCDGHLSYERR